MDCIKKLIKSLEEAVRKTVEEGRGTVEISMKEAIDLCFILPTIQELIKTINERPTN